MLFVLSSCSSQRGGEKESSSEAGAGAQHSKEAKLPKGQLIRGQALKEIEAEHKAAFESGEEASPLKKEFYEKYRAWQKHCNRLEIAIQSNSSYYINVPEYDALIAMGKPALPFLMEKLGAGEFFLNKAVEKITGIDLKAWKPDFRPVSEQDTSKVWLEWWEENKDKPEWKTASAG